ncbi:hemolysin family protein [Bacteroidetes bacterium endosymbiont of Geopemphigus sp.]|uniref:hemolysin family protein n=1 Tax=Bacteroidetes bacterium endosymbiont of Geopemphigus sp. TaxID=2047937 RepID=UPI000CD263B2|nr:hemolysin family protein [Bacteroidetes bacterium endosymbiont of Geopemphigus sp.]
MISGIFFILITLVLSAFFSGMEMALISCNRFQIELQKKKENLSSKLLSRISAQSRRFIATMLIGNNIVLVIYGLYMGDLMTELLLSNLPSGIEPGLSTLLLQSILSTIIILVTAEFLPKVFFGLYAVEVLNFFAIPAYIAFQVLSPITTLLMWLSDKFLRISGEKEQNETRIFDREDLTFFVSEKIENLRKEDIESEVEIFHRALDFSQIKARECMVPRNEVVAVNIDDSIEEITKKFIKNGLSKILVCEEGDLDKLKGYLHYFELFKKPKDLGSILLPVEFVHATMRAQEVMNLLIRKHKSIAIVLDEYGGTAGLITIEDLLEEFLGNIEDEHDKNHLLEKKLRKAEFLFSARLEINYLNDKYRFDLPSSEQYETIGGLVVAQREDIPKVGESVQLKNIYIEVRKVSKNKIEEVFVRRNKA